MITWLWITSLTGCAWLMENPDEIRREKPRAVEAVTRSNQIDVQAPAVAGRAGTQTNTFTSTGDTKKPVKRYNPVVTPVMVDGPPLEFKNSSGVRIIRPDAGMKDSSGYSATLKKASSDRVRKMILEERETARSLPNN
jgi:hypothetical protein